MQLLSNDFHEQNELLLYKRDLKYTITLNLSLNVEYSAVQINLAYNILTNTLIYPTDFDGLVVILEI